MRLPWSLLILLFSLGIYAQEAQLISRDRLMNAILENGNTLKIEAQKVSEAQGDFRQSNALFLPKISASYSGMTTTNPLVAFGAKLNQEVITQNDFNPSLLNDPTRTDNFALKIAVQQPLLNLDGVFQRKAASAKYQATQFQEARMRQYLELEASKSYMELQLAYTQVQVLRTALEAANENLRIARDRHRQGFMQQSDLLAVEVRATEAQNQLQNAQSAIKNLSDYLAVLMNETGTNVYQPADTLILQQAEPASTSLLENRADLKAMEWSTDAYKQQFRSDKMSFLPHLNAFGSYELYDDEPFQAQANGYLLGASLSWDLLDGSKRMGKVQKSRAAYERAELEYKQYRSESLMEYRKAERMYQDARNNLKLMGLALDQSRESLRIRTNRFREGLENTNDLLLAEAGYAEKQLAYYQTVFQHNYALAYLAFLTK